MSTSSIVAFVVLVLLGGGALAWGIYDSKLYRAKVRRVSLHAAKREASAAQMHERLEARRQR